MWNVKCTVRSETGWRPVYTNSEHEEPRHKGASS